MLSPAKLHFELKTTPSEVSPFVEVVRSYADTERSSLGFLPSAVYRDAAQRGDLLVAIVQSDGSEEYAGHLMFRAVFPRIRVVQLFTRSEFRGQGIAEGMLTHLVNMAERHGFLSICASVAQDLKANTFWERFGFQVIKQKAGGITTGRVINVRLRRLNSPTLFTGDAVVERGNLELPRLDIRSAVYAIDLNVFWDIVHRRPRVEYATQIIAACFNSVIRVVVTKEFINELRRTTDPGRTDPALEFAMQLPALSQPSDAVLRPLLDELATLIFPGKILSTHDGSDLLHLATAIDHSVAAFLTSEDRIVSASDRIFARFGVAAIHVRDFAVALKSTQTPVVPLNVYVSGDTLRIWEVVQGRSEEIAAFLDLVDADEAAREDFLSPQVGMATRKRIFVTSELEIVCMASWDATAGLQNRAKVRILCCEDHAAIDAALDCVISKICREASQIGPVLLSLDVPSNQAATREKAILHGFRAPLGGDARGDGLQKICLGRLVCSRNWLEVVSTLGRWFGLTLPDSPPQFISNDQHITYTNGAGLERTIRLEQLETLLSPVLVALPGRDGIIVPIQKNYADDLFGTSVQMSWLPGKEAILFSERTYFSTARNAKIFSKGTPLLFYESGTGGGRSAVVAAGRVIRSSVFEKSSISATLLRRGVLEPEQLETLTTSDQITATTFGSIVLFNRSVPLKRLKDLDCVDGANLVTARPISYEKLSSILMEAQS